MYDPDRAQTVQFRGQVRGWSDFASSIRSALGTQKGKQGAGLRFLTEAITSPTMAEQITLIQQAYPQAKWHQWDPAGAATGRPDTDAMDHFDKADVVLSLDADFLTCGPESVRYSRDFGARRRVTDDKKEMNRLYAVESTPTLTGAKADHRLSLRASEIEPFARALSSALSGGAASTAAFSNANATRWLAAVAKDLQAHRGRCLVVAGDYQPAAVHQLADAMNQSLGNAGTTVTYAPTIVVNAADQLASLRDLVQAMDAGHVDVLVMLGTNPVFTAPADLKFRERLGKVALSIHHSLYADETSAYCHWNLPEAHPLETWGDARAFDGTVTIMQPLIAPLYEGRGAIEVLGSFIDAQNGKSAHDLVKDYWTRAHAGAVGGWTITDPSGQPFKSADSFWKHVLHDGFIPGTASQAGAPPTSSNQPPTTTNQPPTSSSGATGGLEIIFRPDQTIGDGRYANNGWLQELPKPLTKATWDPTAWVSVNLAQQQRLQDGDLIELRYRGNTALLPVAIVPGHPDNAVTAFFGYGRERVGRVGSATGDEAKQFDVYKLRTSDAPWFGQGLEIAKVGRRYLVARTQEHFLMEGRNPVRVGTLEEYRARPEFVAEMGEKPPRALSIIPDWEYNSYKWAMAIDLQSCTGCSTCTLACQAENNIPVVGKEEVDRGREMMWIRVDAYFSGSPENPETYHQPVPCMQCENAPCELVCPVGATAHSAEGLNDMVYNRCVGTRYCSNNCPYKVRRFNFLLYSDWNTQSLYPLRNPDVTVRSRGVMEKCTYCVQRINAARIDAKREDRSIRDGEVVPACAAACPADAIVFGDMNDPNSRVSKLKAQQRNYGLVEELNTRPRTTYLAALRNPNPELEAARGASATEH
jgi:molybdopterin-containing oxidoreductase family iron-sulfur binding subunit